MLLWLCFVFRTKPAAANFKSQQKNLSINDEINRELEDLKEPKTPMRPLHDSIYNSNKDRLARKKSDTSWIYSPTSFPKTTLIRLESSYECTNPIDRKSVLNCDYPCNESITTAPVRCRYNNEKNYSKFDSDHELLIWREPRNTVTSHIGGKSKTERSEALNFADVIAWIPQSNGKQLVSICLATF